MRATGDTLVTLMSMEENGLSIIKSPGFLRRLLTPFARFNAWARHVRILHPRGMVYRAEVVALANSSPMKELGERISGDAMIRLSGAWWRGNREWKDVLGCAVRFLPKSDDEQSGEQDLVFATVRRPWTSILAAFTTDPHDFLENDYYAVSTLEVVGLGRAKWRLIPHRARTGGRNRWQKLERAVLQDLAAFRVDVLRIEKSKDWVAVAEIRLKERMSVDQETRRFSPFSNGRGIEHRGLIHGLRIATNRGNQKTRPQVRSE